MSTQVSTFYITGGTARHDVDCDVEQRADRDLYQGLKRGKFCYALFSIHRLPERRFAARS